MKLFKLFILVALLVLTWSAKTFAQVEQATIRVDGLACPFCSYGLEKKLKEIKGVGKVTISVNKGLATLKSKPMQNLEVEQLVPVVKDAGFTPGEVTVTAAGMIGEHEGTPVFIVSGTEIHFMLKSNAQLEKWRTEGGAKQIRVTGKLALDMPTGHRSHPYTLTLENVEAK
jgi:copper chaperone CopZ